MSEDLMVPRELLERLSTMELDTTPRSIRLQDELRALLSEQPQAIATQSASAGEREAFEAWLGIKPCGAAHDLAVMAFQAGASWQRTQAAGVPVQKLIEGLDEISALSRYLRQGGCDSTDLSGLEEGLTHAIDMATEMLSMLDAAPAQPASHDQSEKVAHSAQWPTTPGLSARPSEVQRLRKALGEADRKSVV